MEALLMLIVFAVVLTAVIVPHELGHMLAAKFFGMKVPSFSVGFGPVLFRKTVKETEYRFSALPLGGYVMIPAIEGRDPDTSVPRWQKFIVFFAGPAASFLFGALLLSIILSVGYSLPSTVMEVTPGSPAAEAGLEMGDIIVAVDGVPLHDVDWPAFTESKKSHAVLTVDRPTGMTDVRLPLPVRDAGATIARAQQIRMPVGQAFVQGFSAPLFVGSAIVALPSMVSSGALPANKALGGPLAIATVSRQATRYGASRFFEFIAMFSIFLGWLNLLPIPVLDGGRIAIVSVEMILRRDLAPRTVSFLMHAGFVLIIFIMTMAIVSDMLNFVL